MELPNAFAALKKAAKRRAIAPSPDGQASASKKRKGSSESAGMVSAPMQFTKLMCRRTARSMFSRGSLMLCRSPHFKVARSVTSTFTGWCFLTTSAAVSMAVWARAQAHQHHPSHLLRVSLSPRGLHLTAPTFLHSQETTLWTVNQQQAQLPMHLRT